MQGLILILMRRRCTTSGRGEPVSLISYERSIFTTDVHRPHNGAIKSTIKQWKSARNFLTTNTIKRRKWLTNEFEQINTPPHEISRPCVCLFQPCLCCWHWVSMPSRRFIKTLPKQCWKTKKIQKLRSCTRLFLFCQHLIIFAFKSIFFRSSFLCAKGQPLNIRRPGLCWSLSRSERLETAGHATPCGLTLCVVHPMVYPVLQFNASYHSLHMGQLHPLSD